MTKELQKEIDDRLEEIMGVKENGNCWAYSRLQLELGYVLDIRFYKIPPFGKPVYRIQNVKFNGELAKL